MSIEMAFLRAGLLKVSQPIEPCFFSDDALGQLACSECGLLRKGDELCLIHERFLRRKPRL